LRARPAASTCESFISARQLIRQYGRHQLWIHVALGQLPRLEHRGDRLHHLRRLAAPPLPRLLSQLLEQPVEHLREAAPGLERVLAEREGEPLHRTLSHCGAERLRRLSRSSTPLP